MLDPLRDPERLALLAILALAPVLPAAADSPGRDQPFPISLAVGGVAKICRTGTVLCPATGPICDDPSIASMRAGDEGLEIVGLKPGRTLCSAASANFVRQVYSVTVRPRQSPSSSGRSSR